MTPNERFTLLIAGMGLLFAIMCAVLGLIWRAGNQWGVLTTDVEHIARSLQQIARDTNRRLERIESGKRRTR